MIVQMKKLNLSLVVLTQSLKVAYWTSNMYREVHNIFACSGILFNHESHIRPNYFVTKKIISSAYRISMGSTEKLELGDLAVVRDWVGFEYVEAMWLMLQQEVPENCYCYWKKSFTKTICSNSF